MGELDKKRIGCVIRWIARIVGTSLFLMLIVFAIGEGLPNPVKQPLAVRIELFAMFIIWVGFIVAWKWELIGSILILSGYACFFVVERQAPSIHFPFGLFLLVGLLYLFSWWSRERES